MLPTQLCPESRSKRDRTAFGSASVPTTPLGMPLPTVLPITQLQWSNHPLCPLFSSTQQISAPDTPRSTPVYRRHPHPIDAAWFSNSILAVSWPNPDSILARASLLASYTHVTVTPFSILGILPGSCQMSAPLLSLAHPPSPSLPFTLTHSHLEEGTYRTYRMDLCSH